MDGAAQEKVIAFGHVADIHITEDTQQPEPGTIIDTRGDNITSRGPSMMVRLDEKAKEAVTLSRGTLWFIGTALTVIPVIILLAAYLISGAMGYQTVLSRVGEAEKRLDKMEKAFDDVQTLKMTTQSVQSDVKSIKDKQAADDADRKKLINDVSDIRIMLGQKSLNQ